MTGSHSKSKFSHVGSTASLKATIAPKLEKSQKIYQTVYHLSNLHKFLQRKTPQLNGPRHQNEILIKLWIATYQLTCSRRTVSNSSVSQAKISTITTKNLFLVLFGHSFYIIQSEMQLQTTKTTAQPRNQPRTQSSNGPLDARQITQTLTNSLHIQLQCAPYSTHTSQTKSTFTHWMQPTLKRTHSSRAKSWKNSASQFTSCQKI